MTTLPCLAGEQCGHRLLHRDALRDAAARLHLHHGLQVGDDQAHGRRHARLLRHLRHRVTGALRVLVHLPLLRILYPPKII